MLACVTALCCTVWQSVVKIVPHTECQASIHSKILGQHAVSLASAQFVDLATVGMLPVCDTTQCEWVWGWCRGLGAVAGKGRPQPLNEHA